MALLSQFLACFGTLIGRSAHYASRRLGTSARALCALVDAARLHRDVTRTRCCRSAGDRLAAVTPSPSGPVAVLRRKRDEPLRAQPWTSLPRWS